MRMHLVHPAFSFFSFSSTVHPHFFFFFFLRIRKAWWARVFKGLYILRTIFGVFLSLSL